LRKLLTVHGRSILGIIVLLIACMQAVDFIPSNTIERLDIFFYDLRVRVQDTKLDPRVVIIDIDERNRALALGTQSHCRTGHASDGSLSSPRRRL
jgi:adenylate cyclase